MAFRLVYEKGDTTTTLKRARITMILKVRDEQELLTVAQSIPTDEWAHRHAIVIERMQAEIDDA